MSAAGLVTGLAGQGTAGAAPPGRLPGRVPGPPRADDADWRWLRRHLSPKGRLYRPGEEPFEKLATPWNLRYADHRPAGIVACATAADVQAAVRWARTCGMPLVPRSGGHNYAGYSTTPGLLISLRPMNEIARRGDRLWVCGGATNADVFESGARKTGLYVPGGRCMGVGVAGLTLGGGLGFNDRKWGLTCDRLVETEVVLADGSLVRASRDECSDLFWACRGGAGGNFGINTGFLYDPVDVGRVAATVFEMSFALEEGVKVMRCLQHLLAEDDPEHDLDVRIEFGNPGTGPRGARLAVLGQYLGDKMTLYRRLQPLLRLRPRSCHIGTTGFWAAQKRLSMVSEHEAMTSRSLVPCRWLDDEAVCAIIEWIREWRPGRPGNTGYVTLFAMGGAIADLAPRATAFPHRKATFVMDIGASWDNACPDEVVDGLLAQTRAMHRCLSRLLGTRAAYVNFPDPDLPDWPTAYYGGNYRRLTQVKKRYDPDWVFRYPQGVRPY
ncbi:FAD-binding oxidoreductase [Actinomadura fibrosa]|uniref:FAD-binding oxidoreductase n=1 Tax=Actinomadura fibrosa TaxID=111802 RepID=A0ABW2XQF2_9ACTN|nr:FAD-binding oxidoreductase [Actinomadura fibrosa]